VNLSHRDTGVNLGCG